METITYHVPSISCNHCVHTIVNELNDLQGVLSVQADLTTKQVKVDFQPPADDQKIQQLLAEINYPVVN
jgi:copper chaperone CopZ